ncbi:MAG: AsnC family transcriptional regulator [Candidatus Woesearchaeota archaeon]
MQLDEIDKKVLFELSQDARQSYKDIARKINSKKDTVAYHIS